MKITRTRTNANTNRKCSAVKFQNPNLERKCRVRPAAPFAYGTRVKGILYGCIARANVS